MCEKIDCEGCILEYEGCKEKETEDLKPIERFYRVDQ